MGINSTEVSYGFGQLGSGFVDDGGAFIPPTGKVIVAIQFLADTTLSVLTPDSTQGNDAAFFGLADQVAGNGTNSETIDGNQIFPKGLTIYGRWTAVTAAADADGGIICYFGE